MPSPTRTYKLPYCMNPKIDQLICIWDNIAANRNPTHQFKCIRDNLTTNRNHPLKMSLYLHGHAWTGMFSWAPTSTWTKSQGIFMFLHVCIYICFSADMSTERVKCFIYLYIYWDENKVMICDHG
jgi:hypothetical protein